jgi:hypothetical protein
MEYTWKIKSLVKQNTDDLDNVIIGTRWTVTGTNEDGITGEFQGATPLELDSASVENFTAFENLTETQVLSWIQSKVSGSAPTSYWDHITERIGRQIQEKVHIKISVEETELPWSGSAE